MKPHIFHINDGRRKWWVIGDGSRTVRGRLGEPMMGVFNRWVDQYGSPPDGCIRVSGYCSPAEAAAQLGHMAMAEGGAS